MSQTDLTQGSVPKQLTRMTLPMMWGILAIMSMNIVDTFFVGQLGKDALAAMGFTMPIISILLAIAFGVGGGVSSVTARAIGAQRWDKVRSYCSHGVLIAISLSASFAYFGVHSIELIFTTLGADETLLPLIESYMAVWFLGSFVIVIPMVGNSAIRASGNTKVPSIVMISVAITNIILDPILIFGLFGAPRMELAGAALATVIAYSVALLIGLYFLIIKLKFLSLSGLRDRVVSSWLEILKIAVPSTANTLIAPLSVAIITWMVASHGAEAVAGLGVATRIESFLLVILMALSSIMGPYIGQNLGAKKHGRVLEGLAHAFKFSFLWGIAMALLLWLGGRALVLAFNDDAAVVDAALSYLYLVPISYGALGVIMVTASSATGAGNPFPALLMTLLRLLIIYLPLAWFLSENWGLAGIFVAAAIANALVGLGGWLWAKDYFKDCELKRPESA